MTATQTEIKFVADDELMQKFEKVKQKFSHKLTQFTYIDLFKMMADECLKEKSVRSHHSSEKKESGTLTEKSTSPEKFESQRKMESRYIPVGIKRRLWQRDEGQCSTVDSQTGRRCRSRHRVQIDHIRPLALGGKTVESNLRLVCQTHNLWMATQCLGKRTMGQYIQVE